MGSFPAGANTRIEAFKLPCTPGILNGFGALQTMRNWLFNSVGKTSLQVLHCSNSTLEGAKCQRGPWIDTNLISEITLMAVLQNSPVLSLGVALHSSSLSPDREKWGLLVASRGRKTNKSHGWNPGRGSRHDKEFLAVMILWNSSGLRSCTGAVPESGPKCHLQ